MKTPKLIASACILSLALTTLPGVPGEPEASASANYLLPNSCGLSGVGSSANPHQIFSVSDLLSVEACVDETALDIHFRQMTNLYLDPNRNYPSVYLEVSGTDISYDGNGFGIFDLNSSVDGNAGLFSSVENRSDSLPSELNIKNLLVSAGTIEGRDDGGNAYVGVIVGDVADMSVNFESVSVLVGDLFGETSVGGLIGSVYQGNLSIRNSSVRAQSIHFDRFDGGGLVGSLRGAGGSSEIINSSAIATITGGPSSNGAGGLVGEQSAGSLRIDRSSFTGSISVGGDWGTTVGGLVGEVITFDRAASLTVRDSVVEAGLTGGGYLGGLLGIGNNYDGDHPIDFSVTNTIVTGQLNSSGEYTAGAGLLGEGSETHLNVDNVIVDLLFRDVSVHETEGHRISSPALTSIVSGLFINDTKLTGSDWSFFQVSADSFVTNVEQADFGVAASFPGFTFGAPNGAPTAGVLEVCPAGTRPFHSIESSSCFAPAVDYQASLVLEFGQFARISFVGDPNNFELFTVGL